LRIMGLYPQVTSPTAAESRRAVSKTFVFETRASRHDTGPISRSRKRLGARFEHAVIVGRNRALLLTAA
jgi:hypothetical protein